MIFHRQIWHRQLRDAMWYWCLIPAAVIGSGLLLDRLLGLPLLSTGRLWQGAASAALVVGLFFIWRSSRDLHRLGHGTPSPFRPARRLVTVGVYGLCRHPMFFGYDLAALGVVMFCRSPAMLFVSLPVMVGIEIVFLRKEERLLAKRFRKDYPAYRQRVPMLVPWPGRRGADRP